jgi:hypothetical protein
MRLTEYLFLDSLNFRFISQNLFILFHRLSDDAIFCFDSLFFLIKNCCSI